MERLQMGGTVFPGCAMAVVGGVSPVNSVILTENELNFSIMNINILKTFPTCEEEIATENGFKWVKLRTIIF